jgi:hypothetical protein
MITHDFGDGDRITVGGIGEYPRGETGLVEDRERTDREGRRKSIGSDS